MTVSLQKDLLNKIQAALNAGNAKIATLDPGLKPEVRADRIRAIRNETLGAIGETHADMTKRGASAREGLPHWSQDAVRRRAKFADDPATDAQQRIAIAATLARTSTPELTLHLADAIREKNVAKAEAVRVEFNSRSVDAERRMEFARAFAAVVDPVAKNMEKDLGLIDGLAAHAETLILEFARGRSDPVARMSTARQAGLVPVDGAPVRQGFAA